MSLLSHRTPARGLAIEMGERRDNGEESQSIDRLVDAAVEAAPDLVRGRLILPAVDWTCVAPAKVARMLARIEHAGINCPRWLSKAILIAGHTVEDTRNLPGDLTVLNRVNMESPRDDGGAWVAPLIEGLIDDEAVEVEIVDAIVERLAVRGSDEHAVRLALGHAHRTRDAVRAVTAQLDKLLEHLRPVRLRLTGFSTTQILAEALRPTFAAQGWQADVVQSEFGAGLADLNNVAGEHDALILLLDLEGFVQIDWRNAPARVAELISERAELLARALSAFAERSEAPLLINTIASAYAPSSGFLDGPHGSGVRRTVDLINARLYEVASRSGRIVVIDSDQAMADIQRSRQIDQKLWFYGRIAYSADATWAIARGFAQAWNSLRRGPIKVLAVDLDNTLWGGIYGDDGVERLACGHEFPGNAFMAMQQECLRLRSQGILLVALSKNNADAMSVFERHPEMALKPSDFAATAVNWDPKPENIRKVAAELNLALDSFLFIDDSPHERDAMRRLCPEVRVPEMPADPAERPLWLRRLACTWPVRLTAEDEERGASYAAGKEAERWRASTGRHEDFLRGLEQHLRIGHVDKNVVSRIAQMHQRTNQFNLTTIRSTEADIASVFGDGSRGVAFYGRASDRFGDHGIVIAAVAEIEGSEAVLRSFLMSCRVIGREIERAFLGEVLGELRQRGVSYVFGKYVPTAKNAMVRDFYPSCGFMQLGGDDGGTNWLLDLSNQQLPGSKFVTVGWES